MSEILTPSGAAHAIDPQAAASALAEWRSRPAGEIEAELTRLSADQRQAVDQAGEALDFTKSDILGGKTVQEKVTSLIELHSSVAGVQDALNQRRALETIADRIRSGDSDTGLDEAMEQAEQQLPQAVANPYGGAVPYMAEPRVQTIGDVFMEAVEKEHGGLKNLSTKIKGGRVMVPIDLGDNAQVMNATFETAQWPPFVTRLPGYVPDAQRPIFFLDVIPRYTTDQNSIKYMEETVFTNEAEEKAEGTAYDESALTVAEQTVPVRDIGTHIPASEDVLADEMQTRSYITQRLPFMVRQRADAQTMAGDGSGQNLQGVTTVTGVQNQAQAGTSGSPTKPLNVVRQAMTACRLTGRAMPSHILIHQSYWESMVLSETTAAGFYLGSAVMGMQNRLWGLPVVEGDSGLTWANNGIAGVVGDFTRFGACAVRKDASIMVGFINDDFTRRQIRFRADMRLAAVWYRPAAFVTLTRTF